MRALVISGGGSKGAFAGGVAQYLIEEEKRNYDLFLGTSTGSLLVSHLALKKFKKLKKHLLMSIKKVYLTIPPILLSVMEKRSELKSIISTSKKLYQRKENLWRK